MSIPINKYIINLWIMSINTLINCLLMYLKFLILIYVLLCRARVLLILLTDYNPSEWPSRDICVCDSVSVLWTETLLRRNQQLILFSASPQLLERNFSGNLPWTSTIKFFFIITYKLLIKCYAKRDNGRSCWNL